MEKVVTERKNEGETERMKQRRTVWRGNLKETYEKFVYCEKDCGEYELI